MLSLEGERDGWRPPVLTASAATGGGVTALADALADHAAWLAAEPERRARRARERARYELEQVLREELLQELRIRLAARFEDIAREVADRRVDPYSAARRAMSRMLRERGPGRRYLQLVERDGDTISFFGFGPRGFIELMAEITVEGDTLVVRRAHVMSTGPGACGIAELRVFGRMLAHYFGTRRIIVYGATRESGARRGRTPRPIVIEAD
jgi:hypothetical protein